MDNLGFKCAPYWVETRKGDSLLKDCPFQAFLGIGKKTAASVVQSWLRHHRRSCLEPVPSEAEGSGILRLRRDQRRGGFGHSNVQIIFACPCRSQLENRRVEDPKSVTCQRLADRRPIPKRASEYPRLQPDDIRAALIYAADVLAHEDVFPLAV